MDGKLKSIVKGMKNKRIMGMIMGAVVLVSCTPEPIGQTPIDNIAPASVTNALVKNTAGGAVISYDVPNDEDILYVKAVYKLGNNLAAETKASVYKNTLEIEGFGDSDEREILLYAVDRSGNQSVPLAVTVNPLTPVIHSVYESLSLHPDFGGVRFSWGNETESNISISLMMKKDGELVPLDMLNTNRKEGSYSVRGLEAEASEFALFVSDRWDNISDTLITKILPLFETQIEQDRIKGYPMAGDTKAEWGWVLSNLWDNNTGTGFHTETTSGPWPHRFTFQMLDGALKVSRFKIHQRTYEGGAEWSFAHGNIREFELFGSNAPNPNGSYDGWDSMGKFESFKPSGLPIGELTNEDKEHIANGEEFSVNPDLPAYKYFRIKVTESWSGGNFMHAMEIPFWGAPEGLAPEIGE